MPKNRQAKRWLNTGSVLWRAIRNRKLREEPFCRECARYGLEEIATEVDHINGRAEKREDYEDHNLQSLCASCHSRKTHAELGFGDGIMKGCDIDGTPWRLKRN